MRNVRSALVGLGTLIILLTFVGFATFSPDGVDSPRPETTSNEAPAPLLLAADAGSTTGRVTAFVFATQLQVPTPTEANRAPAIDKEAGEFVSPTDAIVMHVVQLDTLKAVFAVPLDVAADLKVRQQVTLAVGVNKAECRGIIEFVSPTAQPQTATVEVKIRIPNQNGKIQCGAACVWDMTAVDAQEQISQHRMPAVR